MTANLAVQLDGFPGGQPLELVVEHRGTANQTLPVTGTSMTLSLAPGVSTLIIRNGSNALAIEQVAVAANNTVSTLPLRPNIPYLVSVDAPPCPFTRGGQAEFTIHAGNLVARLDTELHVDAVGTWKGSTLQQVVPLAANNGTSRVAIPLSGGSATSGSVEFQWRATWNGTSVAAGKITSASCPFADCPSGTETLALAYPVERALGKAPFCIPSGDRAAYGELRSLVESLNSTAATAIHDIRNSSNATMAEKAWRTYNKTVRAPTGTVAAIRSKIEGFQMDQSPLPTWDQLATVKTAVATIDSEVDQAFRETSQTRFDSAETALQGARWQLSMGIGLTAASGALAATAGTWVWGRRWKTKVARWIGYDAGFRALDATKFAAIGCLVALVVGAAIALPFGLLRLFQVLLR
ncbi:MAG: hypothetical protein V4510_05655 [bacterium]